MTTKDFLLPDLGEGLTEGEIVRWLVAVGDAVEVDQPVAEVETAKAVVEVPSPFEGTVAALHGEAGEEVQVGQPLITIEVGGSAGGAAGVDAAAGETPADAEVADMVPDADEGEGDDASGNVLVGYGTGASSARRRRRGVGGPGGPSPASGAGGHERTRPLAKPPVRKLAKDLGVDLAEVPGSGPEGIVTREDVTAFAARQEVAAAPTTAAPAAPAAEAPPVAVPQAPSEDLVERRPLKGMRKAIAAQMTRSRAEIPEAVTWVDVDATRLVELRDELDAAHDDVKITPLAVLLRAVVAGLKRFPEVNSRLDRERGEIVLQRFVHLGVAVQTDAGLMVPVIKGADRMTTVEIAAELDRLAAGARDRSLSLDELQGSTFTISNYGAFGVDGGDMVINYPEAAILGVGRIADRPWVVDGELAVRKVMTLSIAFDHRVCDGGEAAGFLRYLGDLVESPAALLGAL